MEGGWNGISNLGASTTRTSESGTYTGSLPEPSLSLPSSSLNSYAIYHSFVIDHCSVDRSVVTDRSTEQ